MTKEKARKPLKKNGRKTRWGRIALVWVLAAATVIGVVERKEFPAQVRDNKVTVAVYKWRDSLETRLTGVSNKAAKSAAIEPAAGNSGAGYNAHDRKELESLISRGSYNQ